MRPSCMRLSHVLTCCCILAVAMAAGACGSRSAIPARSAGDSVAATADTPPCVSGSGFALSLVSDRGGQPTPVRAAEWFARHGQLSGIPAGGWRETSRDSGTAVVESGPVKLHVVEGPDRTWQVDSGERCASMHG
jgi:hypothetical protein